MIKEILLSKLSYTGMVVTYYKYIAQPIFVFSLLNCSYRKSILLLFMSPICLILANELLTYLQHVQKKNYPVWKAKSYFLPLWVSTK